MDQPSETTNILLVEPKKMTISERRASYPLQERIKIYNPDTMARKLDNKPSTKLVVHGVNILNKTSVDSDTAMNRIQQRRQTHNRVERRRRDKMNSLISQLATLIPEKQCNTRAKVLKYTIEYIQDMKQENRYLQEKLGLLPSTTKNHEIIVSSPSSYSSQSTFSEEDLSNEL